MRKVTYAMSVSLDGYIKAAVEGTSDDADKSPGFTRLNLAKEHAGPVPGGRGVLQLLHDAVYARSQFLVVLARLA